MAAVRLSLREKLALSSRQKAARIPVAVGANERLYTIAEIAERWRVSDDTVYRMFRSESGVLKIGGYRIPESVMLRVQERRRIV